MATERPLRHSRRSEVPQAPSRRSITNSVMPPPSAPPPSVTTRRSGLGGDSGIPHRLLSAAATEKPPPIKVVPSTPVQRTPRRVSSQRLTEPLHDDLCYR